jgi:type I restriction enzyme M protein
MNLAIRGISADIRQGDTFHNDQHKDLKADYIMANPPFNQNGWREENQLNNDPRWSGYETPPTSNANYGWILNILSKLSTNVVEGFLLANGTLSADGTELAIRRKLIENDKVEAILILPRNLFYSTDISVTLWILNNNKKARVVTKNGNEIHYRDRENEILFMDLRQMGIPFEKKYVELDPDTRDKVTQTYHCWQQVGYEETYQDTPEYCKSVKLTNIVEKKYSLIPSNYIEFIQRDSEIDFDKEMSKLASELQDILKERAALDDTISSLFAEYGHEIK